MVSEVTANLVAPAESHLKTLVLHVTCIHVGRLLIAEHHIHRGLYQPVLRGLLIPVEVQSEAAAKEACIQTDIQLLRGLPSHVGVGNVLCIGTSGVNVVGHRLNHIAGELVAIVGISAGGETDVREIVEVTNLTVTVLSPRCTELQEAQPRRGRLHELLVRDVPTCRYRGKITPAMTACEVV